MKKRWIAIALAGVMLMTSCGSAGSSASYAAPAEADYSYAEEAAYDYEAGGGANGYYEEAAAEEAPAEESMGGDDTKATEAAKSAEKLVYTCVLRMQTLTYEKTMAAVRSTIKSYGSIVESEETTDEDYNWYSDDGKRRGTLRTYLTVRVPSAQYEAFLKDVEGTGGKTLNKSMSVENITTAYNDQSIRIEALETQEERLMEMMKKAETVEDMIYVEQRLSEVQMELNQAKSHLSKMDTDVALSTVHLTIEEVVEYSKTTYEKNFFERTAETFADSIDNFLRAMEGILDLFIYLLPFMLLIGVIIVIVLFATRKQRALRRVEKQARKAAKKEAKAAQKEARAAQKAAREAAREAARQEQKTPPNL